MTPQRAAEVLAVDLDALTSDLLTDAYRRTVFLAHPDTGGGAGGVTVADAVAARKALILYLADVDEECVVCGGNGHFWKGFRRVECPACRGR